MCYLQIYSYEQLKSFKGEYPPAVDSSMIEVSLT